MTNQPISRDLTAPTIDADLATVARHLAGPILCCAQELAQLEAEGNLADQLAYLQETVISNLLNDSFNTGEGFTTLIPALLRLGAQQFAATAQDPDSRHVDAADLLYRHERLIP